MAAPGAQQIWKALDAGYSEDEVRGWVAQKRQEALDNGYTPSQFDEWLGMPAWNDAPIREQFQRNFAAKPPKDITEAFIGGWQGSGDVLAIRGKLPSYEVGPDSTTFQRLASMAGSMAGDAPAMIAGALLAAPGGPWASAGAAWAVPAAMKRAYWEKAQKGEIVSWKDFWDRSTSTLIDEAKGYLVGEATFGAGKIATPIAETLSGPLQKVLGDAGATLASGAGATAGLASSVAAMTTAGAALEGRIPEPREFVDNTIATLAFMGVNAGARKLGQLWTRTAVPPAKVGADISTDPTILEDIGSTNIETPRTYRPLEIAASATDPGAEPPTNVRAENTVVKAARDLVPERPTEQIGAGAGKPPPSLPAGGEAPPPSGYTPESAAAAIDSVISTGEKSPAMPKSPLGETGWDRFYLAWTDRTHPMYLATQKMWESIVSAAEREKLPPIPENQYAPEAGAGGAGAPPAVPPERAVVPAAEGGAVVPAGETAQAAVTALARPEVSKPGLIPQAIRDLGKELRIEVDPHKQLRMLPSWWGKAAQFLRDQTVSWATNKETGVSDVTGEGLGTILKDLPGETPEAKLAALDRYTVALRTIELTRRGIATPLEAKYPGAAEAYVTAHHAEMEPIAKRDWQFQGRRLDYMVESGILDQKGKLLFEDMNRAHVKFHYILEEDPLAPKGKGTGEPYNPFKAIHDAIEGKIVSPAESEVSDTYNQIRLAEINRVRRAFVEMVEKSPIGDTIARRAKGTFRQINLSEAERKTLFNRAVGEELSARQKAALEQSFAIGRREFSQPKEGEFVVYRDGKPERWEVNKFVWRSLSDSHWQADPQISKLMEWVFTKPARLKRAGVTLSPEYPMRNVARDMLTAFVNAGVHPIELVKGLASLWKMDKYYQEWERSGGPMANLVSADRSHLQLELRNLTDDRGLATKFHNIVENPLDLFYAMRQAHPLEIMRKISEGLEGMTRIGADRYLREQGLSAQEAAYASREATVDFSRGGTIGMELNRGIPFFNAAIQGPARLARALREDPAGVSWRVSQLALLAGLLELHNWQRDQREKEKAKAENRPPYLVGDLNQTQRDMSFTFPVGYGKDSVFVRIPKPQEIGMLFATLPERFVRYAINQATDRGETQRIDTLATSLLNQLVPNFAPPALLAGYEAISNYDTFQNRPIVSQGLERYLPEYRSQWYTSELAKGASKLLGWIPGNEFNPLISPAIIEHTIHQMSGGLGDLVLKTSDQVLQQAGVLPLQNPPAATLADRPIVSGFVYRYPSMSAEPILEFYRRTDESAQVYATLQMLQQQGNLEAFKSLQDRQLAVTFDPAKMKEGLNAISRVALAVDLDPNSNPDQKRQLVDRYYMQALLYAKSANQELDKIEASLKAHQIPIQTAPIREPSAGAVRLTEPRPQPPGRYVLRQTPEGQGRPVAPTLH